MAHAEPHSANAGRSDGGLKRGRGMLCLNTRAVRLMPPRGH